VYLAYLLIVVLVASGNRNTNSFLMKNNLLTSVVR
jgi:hypothetical protein